MYSANFRASPSCSALLITVSSQLPRKAPLNPLPKIHNMCREWLEYQHPLLLEAKLLCNWFYFSVITQASTPALLFLQHRLWAEPYLPAIPFDNLWTRNTIWWKCRYTREVQRINTYYYSTNARSLNRVWKSFVILLWTGLNWSHGSRSHWHPYHCL